MTQTLIHHANKYRQNDSSQTQTKRFKEVTRCFMKQYAEITQLEKDYNVVLANPAVLNLQKKAHELRDIALEFENEGASSKALRYYTDALDMHNDLVLEAFKTVSLQYMIEAKKRLNMTPARNSKRVHIELIHTKAWEAYRKAKALQEEERTRESKEVYRISIQLAFSAFTALS